MSLKSFQDFADVFMFVIGKTKPKKSENKFVRQSKNFQNFPHFCAKFVLIIFMCYKSQSESIADDKFYGIQMIFVL